MTCKICGKDYRKLYLGQPVCGGRCAIVYKEWHAGKVEQRRIKNAKRIAQLSERAGNGRKRVCEFEIPGLRPISDNPSISPGAGECEQRVQRRPNAQITGGSEAGVRTSGLTGVHEGSLVGPGVRPISEWGPECGRGLSKGQEQAWRANRKHRGGLGSLPPLLCGGSGGGVNKQMNLPLRKLHPQSRLAKSVVTNAESR